MSRTRFKARASVNTSFQLHNLLKSREPGTFFGGGIVAGLLLFLLWFAFLPSNGKKSSDSEPGPNAGQGQRPLGTDGAILSAITGGTDFGMNSSASTSAPPEVVEGAPDLAWIEGEVGQSTGEFAESYPGEAASPDAGQPESESFPEARAEIDGVPMAVPEPVLQAWYVEVMRDGNQVEMLEVNAQSPEHALSIVRDYRGNPRVVRGPSTQPLY